MATGDASALVKAMARETSLIKHLLGMFGARQSMNRKKQCDCASNPNIAILDRKGSRQLLNLGAVVEALEHDLLHVEEQQRHNGKSKSSISNKITTMYMEDVSFWDQISFFMKTNILISPHGAQLTGLPFMSHSPCGAVLEIFPAGYCIPWYFGSLAIHSGLNHSYLALESFDYDDKTCHVETERGKARGVKLCPNPQPLIDAMQKLVKEWKRCCCQLIMNKSGSS